MDLKKIFAEDLEETFFNAEEFAEKHTIDGSPVSAIINDSDTGKPDGKKSFNPKDLSLQKESKTIRIMEKDAKRRYAVNSVVTIDGEKMIVYSTKKIHGTLLLTVGKHRA